MSTESNYFRHQFNEVRFQPCHPFDQLIVISISLTYHSNCVSAAEGEKELVQTTNCEITKGYGFT